MSLRDELLKAHNDRNWDEALRLEQKVADAHTERVLAAAAKVGRAEAQLSKFTLDFGWMDAVSALIDAKMELNRLERGGG